LFQGLTVGDLRSFEANAQGSWRLPQAVAERIAVLPMAFPMLAGLGFISTVMILSQAMR